MRISLVGVKDREIFSRPLGSAGSWGLIGSPTHHQAVDDIFPDGDATVIVSGATNTITAEAFDLAPLSPPPPSWNHILFFRGKVVWTGGMTHGITGPQFSLELRNGSIASPGILVATRLDGFQPYTDGTIDNYQDFSMILSGVEKLLIADYADLHCTLEVNGCVNGGDPAEPLAHLSGPNQANTFLWVTQLYQSVYP